MPETHFGAERNARTEEPDGWDFCPFHSVALFLRRSEGSLDLVQNITYSARHARQSTLQDSAPVRSSVR